MSNPVSPKADAIPTGNCFEALQSLSKIHQIKSLEQELFPGKQMQFKQCRPNKFFDMSIASSSIGKAAGSESRTTGMRFHQYGDG
jgi:hypothetical protein